MGSATFSIHWCLTNMSILFTTFHQLQAVQVMANIVLCQTLNKNSIHLWLMQIKWFRFRKILYSKNEFIPVANHRFFHYRFAEMSRIPGICCYFTPAIWSPQKADRWLWVSCQHNSNQCQYLQRRCFVFDFLSCTEYPSCFPNPFQTWCKFYQIQFVHMRKQWDCSHQVF